MAALTDIFLSPSTNSDPPVDSQDPLSVYVQNSSSKGMDHEMSGTSGTFSEPFTLISSTAETLGAATASHANSKSFYGHVAAGKDWIASKHSNVKPWSEFFNPRAATLPRGVGEMTSRILGNLQRYQSNYLFVFLGLLVYCM